MADILNKEAWFHSPIPPFTVIIRSILQGPLNEKTTLLSGADKPKNEEESLMHERFILRHKPWILHNHFMKDSMSSCHWHLRKHFLIL